MKRRSIITQIFTVLLICFLVLLFIQTVFYALWFETIYQYYMISDSKRTLTQYADAYTVAGGAASSKLLSEYADQYESPIFVFNSRYEICDNGLFSFLSTLSLRTEDNVSVRIPVEMSAMAPRSVSSALYSISAVQLGDSRYYDAASIRYDGKTYLYRDMDAAIRSCGQCRWIEPTDNLRSVSYIAKRGSLTSDRAWSLYHSVKLCLILRQDINGYLDELCARDVLDENGAVCRFIYAQRELDGVTTYFVSLSPVSATGTAGRYFNTYFFTIIGVMALLLGILAWKLAKRFVSPLMEIRSVTERIAANDFSVRMQPQKHDELEKLAGNINSMADSLQQNMEELQRVAFTASQNEARMKKMLADVAHEFKTPLGIISAYTEMIESGNFPNENEHYFRIIESEIDSLTNMINDVTQLSQMESGNWKHDPRPCETSDLIESALDRFGAQLSAGSFTVRCSYDSVWVMCDGKRIEQVLTNFISNAIKYAGGRRIIEISCRAQNDVAVISIRNDGNVSAADIQRIWERYYRGDVSDAVRLPSEGIGLEIVREILIIHGSDYGVIQEDGYINFYFSLPICQSEG